MAQSVARRLGKAEVTGSSPANSFCGIAYAMPYFFSNNSCSNIHFVVKYFDNAETHF